MPTITDPEAYLSDVRKTHIGRAVLREVFGPEWAVLLTEADDATLAAMAEGVRRELHRRYPTIFH